MTRMIPSIFVFLVVVLVGGALIVVGGSIVTFWQ